MTKRELLRRSYEALAAFAALPPDEQFRRLIARGTINEKGEVLMGGPEEEKLPDGKDGAGRIRSAREQV